MVFQKQQASSPQTGLSRAAENCSDTAGAAVPAWGLITASVHLYIEKGNHAYWKRQQQLLVLASEVPQLLQSLRCNKKLHAAAANLDQLLRELPNEPWSEGQAETTGPAPTDQRTKLQDRQLQLQQQKIDSHDECRQRALHVRKRGPKQVALPQGASPDSTSSSRQAASE